ncbi:MAG TPA: HAD-IA family hydrolase, partial [Candidatus Acidoferrum sp.]|nr:HAD-IA family hydrolase [Candidatus Acidoferrum sp.]
AVNYALVQMKQRPQPSERIKQYIGFPLERAFHDFTDVPYAELYRHFQVKAASTVVSSSRLLDGVAPTLAELKARGYRMSIATTKIKAHVDGIIAKFGWQNVFELAVGGNEVPRVKPDPAQFAYVIEKLGAKAKETLVVGDTVNDVLAAKGVPVPVAAVSSPYGGTKDTLALNPDYAIDSLPELVALLDRIG